MAERETTMTTSSETALISMRSNKKQREVTHVITIEWINERTHSKKTNKISCKSQMRDVGKMHDGESV